jgi:hypothetical protein
MPPADRPDGALGGSGTFRGTLGWACAIAYIVALGQALDTATGRAVAPFGVSTALLRSEPSGASVV